MDFREGAFFALPLDPWTAPKRPFLDRVKEIIQRGCEGNTIELMEKFFDPDYRVKSFILLCTISSNQGNLSQ